MIDWENFTPWHALGGGALIGLSTALLFASTGKLAGISGILGSLLQGKCEDAGWRVMFLLGLFCSPLIGSIFGLEWQTGATSTISGPLGWAILCSGGLLVGFGTRLANGCTSGHGVCGLARRSKRSAAAVLTFMATGALTVFVTRHGAGV